MSGVVAQAERLWAAGQREAAVALVAAEQALRPDDLELGVRLGSALTVMGRLAEAVAVMRPLEAKATEGHALHAWLGRALGAAMWAQHGPAALPMLRARVAAAPEDPEEHARLAVALLGCGEWGEAWPHYAWRWMRMPGAHRVPAEPLRRPDPAEWRGRRVLLFCEQGHGDTIQFLRYVPMVAAVAGEVVLEVDPEILALARTLPGGARVLAVGEALPVHDFAVPLMHLPWAFGTTVSDVPASVPYLAADPAAVGRWRGRLAELSGRKVGLVWAGGRRADDPLSVRIDRRRSMPLAALAPLARVAGVSFVSLQKGPPGREAVPAGMVLHDWTAELGDFADTAALMAALDLVIAVDTAPLHLAGALGRPVWLLDRYDSCWRWLRERADSPWYPTLRRFRQDAPGEWGPVVARVAAALAAEVGRR
jgi:hypothetical protein